MNIATASHQMCLHIGSSSSPLELHAVNEAVSLVGQRCKDPKFVLVFSTDQYNPHLIAAAMNQSLPRIPWAGCTSAGVFTQNTFLKPGIVIGAFSGENLAIGVGVSHLNSNNGREAGSSAVSQALANLKGNLSGAFRTLMILADSQFGNIAEVVRGACQEGGTMNTWVGGGVGNTSSPVNPATFANGCAYSDSIVAIALDTSQSVVTSVEHGWIPYGPPTLVTRAIGTKAIDLEYDRAFDVYRQIAARKGEKLTRGNFNSFSVEHPFGIPQANGSYVIRDPIGVESDGSINFLSEIPDGCLIRVMEGSPPALLTAAQLAAEQVKVLSRNSLIGAIIFDCISRYLVLGRNYKEELDTFQIGLGEAVPFMGCLTMGEVGSFGKSVPLFHNKTSVVMGLTL